MRRKLRSTGPCRTRDSEDKHSAYTLYWLCWGFKKQPISNTYYMRSSLLLMLTDTDGSAMTLRRRNNFTSPLSQPARESAWTPSLGRRTGTQRRRACVRPAARPRSSYRKHCGANRSVKKKNGCLYEEKKMARWGKKKARAPSASRSRMMAARGSSRPMTF